MATFWVNTNLTCDIETEVPESMFYFYVHFCSQYDTKLCHCSGRHSPVSVFGGPDLIPDQSILIRSKKMQQYAGIYLLQNHSTCFGYPSHPSSGVHKTVTAASGTGHSI